MYQENKRIREKLKNLEDNLNPKTNPDKDMGKKVFQLEERNRILTLDNMEKDKKIAELQDSIESLQKKLQQEMGKSKGLEEPIKKLVIKKK